MKTRTHALRRTLLVACLATGLIAAGHSAQTAEANRRTPPRVSMIYKGEVVQRVRPYTFCWSYGSYDGGASGMCADGSPHYPKAARIEAGSRVRLRIGYPAKPGGWFLEAHRAVVEHEGWHEPVGPVEEIPFRLKPHRVDGVVKAWDLVFRLDEPVRHYYLNTGGDLRQGDAFFALHART